MRLVIANAFSVNMLKEARVLAFVPVSLEFAKTHVKTMKANNVEILSIVGHESTAKLLSRILGIEVPANRVDYKMERDDIMLVFTVPFRLPEGKVLSESELQEYANKLNVFLVAPPDLVAHVLSQLLSISKPAILHF